MKYTTLNPKQAMLTITHSMACINHVIDTLDNIGLNVENDAFDGALYKSFDGMCEIAMDNLDIPNMETENSVYNRLISATRENYEDIVEEVWSLYGTD